MQFRLCDVLIIKYSKVCQSHFRRKDKKRLGIRD
jgi:hypothetical protein